MRATPGVVAEWEARSRRVGGVLVFPPLAGAVADAHDLTVGMLVYVALPPTMLLLVGGLGSRTESPAR